MSNTKLSIITINYNNRDGLCKTIESVVSQDCRDFEYIIIDGGSTDGSVDVIKEHADKINYWVSEKDNGIYHAMNKGVKAAHGEYTLFLNSGDKLYSSKTIKSIFSNELDTDFIFGRLITQAKNEICVPDIITMEYFLHCSPPHPATLIKKSLFDEHQYDERFRIAGDWEFFLFHIIKNNASYKKINVYFAIFDLTGISLQNHRFDDDLKKEVVNKVLLPRIREDYLTYMGQKDEYHRLFYIASRSKLKTLIYFYNVVILKILMFNRGWIKNFSLKIR